MSSRPARTIPEEKGHAALEVDARAAAFFAAAIGAKARSRTALLRHVLAALPLLVAFVLQWTFWPAIKPYAWFLFYPAVFFSSWIGGLLAGLTSSLVSVALVWWFFIPPEYVLMKARPGSLLPAGVFMAMGVLFSISHDRLRKANEKAASALAAARSANDQLQVANAKITGLLEKTRELDQLKTQFFANVSHELRTPLALIIGPTEKLLASSATDERTRRDLDVVARNARLLLKHVNDLLDVSKLEAGKMKLRYVETDLAQLVRLVASHFDLVAQEKHLTYEVDAGGVQRAQIDPDKYQRILLNLLSNAFKYTPAAGRVRCFLRTLRKDDGQLLAILEIADSGPGVRPEHRESVFERFRQVEGGVTRRFGGTGLGLAIAREFVALHGGTISITDAPEGGALFRVETPTLAPPGAEIGTMVFEVPDIAEAAHHAVEELRTRAEASITPSSDGHPVVLVVEDNPDMNNFIRDSLASDYRTECAFNGQEGLAKALDLRPDLVLSDVMMPGMSGDALVKEIRARPELDSVPIMLLTAKADDELRVTLLREGAQDYLMKPFSADELCARVGNLVKVKLADERNRRLNDEMRESNQRLQDMTSQLEAASKELEAFSYSVSHDLRAPLRAINGFSQVLLDGYADRLDSDGKRYLTHVRESAQQMGELIDDLLNLSRVTRAELRRERVDVSELVRLVCARLRKSQPERQVDLVVQDGLVAQADPRLLDVVLTNLLGNAWKFTGKRALARIEFALKADEHLPVYFVRDNGAGFDGKYEDKLFGVFQRLHSAHEFEGTGIGLATVQRIVQRHGGRVWAEGEVDRGATFYFTLEEGHT